jgi:hypothetical protein
MPVTRGGFHTGVRRQVVIGLGSSLRRCWRWFVSQRVAAQSNQSSQAMVRRYARVVHCRIRDGDIIGRRLDCITVSSLGLDGLVCSRKPVVLDVKDRRGSRDAAKKGQAGQPWRMRCEMCGRGNLELVGRAGASSVGSGRSESA